MKFAFINRNYNKKTLAKMCVNRTKIDIKL